MLKCLIGYTGFVGYNLCKSVSFDYYFNSKNISNLSQYKFDLIVCSAAPGSMIRANKNEKEDFKNIESLLKILLRSKTKKIVLISTIGVFNSFSDKNNENSSRYETQLGYGKNRRFFESALVNSGIRTHIIRLPSLFGYNLKKNFLFDIINPSPSFLPSKKFIEIIKGTEVNFKKLLNK